jgi:hypothetical protein
MQTKRSVTPSRGQQKNRNVVRFLQGSETFKALINESVLRAVKKQHVKCESEKTVGEMIAEDRKAFPEGQDLESVVEFDCQGSMPNLLLRDDNGNLFTAFQNGDRYPRVDVQSVTLREAFSWFVERYRNVDGLSGEVGDLMELAIPYLPQL